MCLAVLALGQHPRFPLVLASNRDEFFHRAAAPLAWWQPEGMEWPVLSGRDLTAGGTWLGLTAAGRMALLTNVREPQRHRPDAPSRGALVLEWLRGDQDIGGFSQRHQGGGHNGFNVIAADFSRGECAWLSNRQMMPVRLQAGIHGLSNASLNTPWPKVQRLRSAMHQALATAGSTDALCNALFASLQDRKPAPDGELPDTGVGIDRERLLSPPFLALPAADGLTHYGTRCSTLVVTERTAGGLVTRVLERSFDTRGAAAIAVAEHLAHWPPALLD